MQKEIDAIMLQLKDRNFHSTEQVDEFFEKSLLRVAEKAQSDLKKELIEWAEGKIKLAEDLDTDYYNDFNNGINSNLRALIRKLKK